MNIKLPNFKNKEYNILDFGAVEGGFENVKEAINNAIDKANIEGGGYVVVPSGLYLTGPIFL